MKVHGGPDWLYMDAWAPEVQAYVDHGSGERLENRLGECPLDGPHEKGGKSKSEPCRHVLRLVD